MLEEQQKLLIKKAEGFGRLAERLQSELERSLTANQEELAAIKASTHTFLAQQVEQAEAAGNYAQAQLERQAERFQQAERALRGEIEALQTEVGGERSRGADMQFQLEQVNEFLAIYKGKFEELQAEHEETQGTYAVLSENALRFEQLYREERAKNEGLASQKQSLAARLAKAGEQMDRRLHQEGEAQQLKAAYEHELGKLRAELLQVRTEAAHLHNTLRAASNQVEESRLTVSGAARSEGAYHHSLEQNYQQERQRNRVLEAEVAALRQRADQSALQAHRALHLEDALSAKSDELGDIRRRTVGFEREVGALESEVRAIRGECDSLKKENALLKAKLMEGSQELRRSFTAKEAEGEKQTQRVSEELAAANAELRDERRKSARLQV